MKNLSGIPPIHCLAAFEAAARLGSFERAADELAVSQSAVSHLVRSLEKQLGQRLFERRDRGVRLTLAGREYLEVVRGALRGLAEYSGHRRSRRRQKALRVGVPPVFAREVLVPCVGEFHARHPGCRSSWWCRFRSKKCRTAILTSTCASARATTTTARRRCS